MRVEFGLGWELVRRDSWELCGHIDGRPDNFSPVKLWRTFMRLCDSCFSPPKPMTYLCVNAFPRQVRLHRWGPCEDQTPYIQQRKKEQLGSPRP